MPLEQFELFELAREDFRELAVAKETAGLRELVDYFHDAFDEPLLFGFAVGVWLRWVVLSNSMLKVFNDIREQSPQVSKLKIVLSHVIF